ncbi:uncharacterized protein DUF4124 [Methylobacter tundripaludum]|uniref:Uncharacterized protein DUF4124 n=1 Tax=Methylobacter tundripaludum TaxID=173365 RepID=A0A2S6H239_9GAMM|nr:DUF4124 domain-containing protein [Methylobacter tundripaludum]PPK71523.1 uncharacterized protein DUF4124 [Methylobacter tundripaludum]
MRFTLFILGSLFSVCAFAGIYKCTDAAGKTNYQAKSCDQQHKTVEINVKTGSANSPDEPDREKQVLEQKQQDEKLEQEQLLKKQNQLKQDAMSESAKNRFLIKNNPEKFSAFSIPPYDFDELPEPVKNYQARLPDIERLRRQAAEKALASGLCNRVEGSELHGTSSKKALVFSVDCSSGKNFHFTEQELTQSAPK